MTPVPDEAVRLAIAARARALTDRPDPMVLSEETLTREMLEAALPAVLTEALEASRAASGSPASDDPFIQVVVHPVLQEPLRAWLASRGLRLFPIPVSGDDLRTYGIGISQEAWEASQR